MKLFMFDLKKLLNIWLNYWNYILLESYSRYFKMKFE